jgi:hypothetical protein
MPETVKTAVAVIGIDIGKNSFHVVGLNQRGAIVLTWPGGDTVCQHAVVPMIMPSPFTAPPAGAGIYDNMRTAVEAVFVGRTRAYNRRFLQLSARTISSIRSPGRPTARKRSQKSID